MFTRFNFQQQAGQRFAEGNKSVQILLHKLKMLAATWSPGQAMSLDAVTLGLFSSATVNLQEFATLSTTAIGIYLAAILLITLFFFPTSVAYIRILRRQLDHTAKQKAGCSELEKARLRAYRIELRKTITSMQIESALLAFITVCFLGLGTHSTPKHKTGADQVLQPSLLASGSTVSWQARFAIITDSSDENQI